MRPDSSICVVCKGSRMLCGQQHCPMLQKYYIETALKERLESRIKNSVFGPSPPNIFVGRYGYPDVRYGPMIALSDMGQRDDPSSWFGLPVEDIISFRTFQFRPMQKGKVTSITRKVEEVQEAVMSVKTVDIEASLATKPHFTVSFSSYVQPMGPYAETRDVRIVGNPSIPKAVDEVLNEKMKAVESSRFLFDKGFDVYYLTKVLSAGVLGVKKKMVPTRWSITATDDMVGKYMVSQIREFDTIQNYTVGHAEYMDNHFEVLMMPGNWEFENFEAWAPGTLWTKGTSSPSIVAEHEGFTGRTKYAELEGGGYYASRYAATEYLFRARKQARIVVFREIYEGYQLPLGVWVVRETARKAYENMKQFSSLRDAIQDINSRLRIPVKEYEKQSKILPQSRITDY